MGNVQRCHNKLHNLCVKATGSKGMISTEHNEVTRISWQSSRV